MVPEVAAPARGVGQGDAAQGRQQHVGEHENQTQLIGGHGLGRSAVGKKIELAFLDAIFHLAAGARDPLILGLAVDLRGVQGADDEALGSSPCRGAPPLPSPAAGGSSCRASHRRSP